jgi:hypothetical protein
LLARVQKVTRIPCEIGSSSCARTAGPSSRRSIFGIRRSLRA